VTPRPPAKLVRAGERYMRLTVLEDRVGYSRFLRCVCDCGTEVQVLTQKWGRRQSCGCLRLPAEVPVGTRFGRLTCVATCFPADKFVKCVCDCGVSRSVGRNNWGTTRSCGCLIAESKTIKAKYGGKSTGPEYQAWRNMWKRCTDPSNKAFKDYGARGISVCERWSDFELFYQDMGQRPGSGFSIDRINNDAGYSPSNCRWATKQEQMLNRRKRTHCHAGHEFTPENTRIYRGERYCRACARIRAAKKRALKAGAS